MGKIREYYKIGGLDILLFKAEDMLFHTDNKRRFQQQVILAAEPEQYPQLLQSIYKISHSGGY